MNIIVNNRAVSYDRQGAGKTVVLLHGWGTSKASFSALAVQLAEHYDVINFDAPGFGGSQPPEDAWGVEEYVSWLVTALGKLGVAEPYAFIGHSMGGRFCLQGLGRGKLKSQKLVLIGSAGIAQTKSLRNQSFKAVAKTGKLASRLLPKASQKKLQSKLYEKAGATDYLQSGVLKESFKKFIATDAQEDAAKVSASTLLIYGEHDESTPVSYGERFRELIPGSTLEVVEGGTHFVHEEQPIVVGEMVKRFLAE